MKQINYKKLILPNIPYVFFVYLFDKVGQAVRLAPGADISAKILNITQGFSAAFENALPSVLNIPASTTKPTKNIITATPSLKNGAGTGTIVSGKSKRQDCRSRVNRPVSFVRA